MDVFILDVFKQTAGWSLHHGSGAATPLKPSRRCWGSDRSFSATYRQKNDSLQCLWAPVAVNSGSGHQQLAQHCCLMKHLWRWVTSPHRGGGNGTIGSISHPVHRDWTDLRLTNGCLLKPVTCDAKYSFYYELEVFSSSRPAEAGS